MRYIIIFLPLITILACKDNRTGMPENLRNYTKSTFDKYDSTCMTASDGIFIFKNLNADTVAKEIRSITRRYFGDGFTTQPMQDSIQEWLANDFFSTKTYTNRSWTLKADLDKSKLSCNYKTFYGLERFDINLLYENSICLKKIIGNEGSYEYTENINGISYNLPKNRLRFLGELHIDIRYKPKSLFNTAKQEYYRITFTDTIDVFTTLADSTFGNIADNVRLEEICVVAFDGNINALRNLLVDKIDLNKSGRNWTPLNAAIENNNIECVKLLIEKGANVEYIGGYNGSPLEHAIDISIDTNNNTGGNEGDESTEIIRILLDAGADPRSGVRIAESYGSKKIMAILKEYMRKDRNRKN